MEWRLDDRQDRANRGGRVPRAGRGADGAAAPAGTEAAGKVAMRRRRRGRRSARTRNGGKMMTFRSKLGGDPRPGRRRHRLLRRARLLDPDRCNAGKRVADVDAGFSVSGPPDQLEDIGVYLRAPNGRSPCWPRTTAGRRGTRPTAPAIVAGAPPASATRRSTSSRTSTRRRSNLARSSRRGSLTVQPQDFPLAIMDGGHARGCWTLHVEDDQAGDTFTLNCWWVDCCATR